MAQTWNVGLIGKAGANVSRFIGEDGFSDNKMQPRVAPALGLYVGKIPNGYLGYNASVLISRAVYDVQYAEGNNRFLDADIRFTEVNLNLELHLKRSGEVRPYLFAGGQFLYRRYGEERYINAVIPATYWPSNRINFQTGFGIHFLNIGNWALHPFAGLRINPDASLVYDAPVDQYFIGTALSYSIKAKKRNPYNKCPNIF